MALTDPSQPKTLFPHVNRPGRYLGNEYNTAEISASADINWTLFFPDLYEIGMSHQGLQILYHIINNTPLYGAERCYCPAPDAEALMRLNRMPLTTLETGRPVTSCDLIGITLPHELCYTNILTILDLAHIPFLAADRGADFPIIIGGGTCAFNPEPVADIFDAILIGDGEEAVIDVSALAASMKRDGAGKSEIIANLGSIAGIYVPSRYKPTYKADGSIAAITPEDGTSGKTKRRILANLDQGDHLQHPLVPNAKIVHDRLAVEVARGCTRGCRFCQAGITYRPVRERTAQQIVDLATDGIAHSGFDELSLLSLSTGDYSCLPAVLPELMKKFAPERVAVAMPSMRVGTLTKDLMDQISKVRKTGFTLAPEAGSERLRQTINKGISEEDLLVAAEQAFALGWNLIKLYFMIGLPTETTEDLNAIVDLVNKTRQAGRVGAKGRQRISVSVGTFVPKPHTPFQWERQLSIEESRERLSFLKSQLHTKSITLKYHDPQQSYLEGVFSRGDRRLTPLIVEAWEKGARLDSWSEHFNLDRWLTAAAQINLDLDFYLRQRTSDETLPWSHIDSMVSDDFLISERDKSLDQVYTPDCRYHDCQKCGLCDFKTIKPIVHNRKLTQPEGSVEDTMTPPAVSDQHYRYFVTYSRSGTICYLGHLEFLQIIHRTLRRANINTHFSQGYNPSPKISFGPALPVGTRSNCEFFSMDLVEPLQDIEATKAALNDSLPDGMEVQDIHLRQKRLPQDIVTTYEVVLPQALHPDKITVIESFTSLDKLIIERERKGKIKQVDLRPLVKSIEMSAAHSLKIELINRSGEPGTKPSEILAALCEFDVETLSYLRIKKTSWSELQE